MANNDLKEGIISTQGEFPLQNTLNSVLQAKDVDKDILNAFLGELRITQDLAYIDELKIHMKWCDGGLVRVKIGTLCPSNLEAADKP